MQGPRNLTMSTTTLLENNPNFGHFGSLKLVNNAGMLSQEGFSKGYPQKTIWAPTF